MDSLIRNRIPKHLIRIKGDGTGLKILIILD